MGWFTAIDRLYSNGKGDTIASPYRVVWGNGEKFKGSPRRRKRQVQLHLFMSWFNSLT